MRKVRFLSEMTDSGWNKKIERLVSQSVSQS